MSTVKISTPFNVELDFELADFHKRILAYFIDLFLLLSYAWGMRQFLYGILQLNHGENALGIDILMVSLPMLLYPLICEITFHGQSLGKRVMGIRVMSMDGGEPHVGQYLLRWIFRVFEWPLVFGIVFSGPYLFIQLMLVGFLGIIVTIIIAVTPNSQRLGDLAAGTIVIQTQIKSSLNDTIFQEVSQKNHQVMYPEVMRLSDRDINTIKSVLTYAHKKQGALATRRIAEKIQQALVIQTKLTPVNFLEQLLADYNYLATKE